MVFASFVSELDACTHRFITEAPITRERTMRPLCITRCSKKNVLSCITHVSSICSSCESVAELDDTFLMLTRFFTRKIKRVSWRCQRLPCKMAGSHKEKTPLAFAGDSQRLASPSWLGFAVFLNTLEL